ncbi:Protein of unknown function DUF91 [Actinobacteria bacterium IMCC26256]|nr:Protein of unknown function DUF91 [Actinobacteria bacterium IMCC26256]
MKRYFLVRLGKQGVHSQLCAAEGFIGTDFDIHEDLSRKLPEEWRDFNKEFIPVLITQKPDRSKISAGLACGGLWQVSKGIKQGDIVLSPNGQGSYLVGEVKSDYYYAEGQVLPHRRKVNWLDVVIDRTDMSDALKNSTGSLSTVSWIDNHITELEVLIGAGPHSGPGDPHETDIEDMAAFAMEKHLEDFLVKNWNSTELSKDFIIYEEDGEAVGQQFQTDAGTMDILAISKDKKRLLVIELKRGRTSDAVVGQVLRYMGYVKEQMADVDQTVEGVIIALEDDQKLRWAISSVPAISFYRYQISFKLLPA